MRRIFGGQTLPANGHDPSSSSSNNYSGRPPSPPLTNDSTSTDEPRSGGGGAKGWFGAVADSLSTTSSSGRSRAQTISRPGAGDEDEFAKLPFGSARLVSPPMSEYGGHAREGSGGRVSVLSGRDVPREDKDNLMVELLSGQAAVEAKDYPILDWDTMQDLKKVSLRPLSFQSQLQR